MPVLTTLTQFEQDDIENHVIDSVGCSREIARKIVADVLVPEVDRRTATARREAFDGAIVDIERMDRIQKTPLDDVTDDDLTWSRHVYQQPMRELTGLSWTKQRPALVEWLRGVSLRGVS